MVKLQVDESAVRVQGKLEDGKGVEDLVCAEKRRFETNDYQEDV